MAIALFGRIILLEDALNPDDWNSEVHQSGWVNEERQEYTTSPVTFTSNYPFYILAPEMAVEKLRFPDSGERKDQYRRKQRADKHDVHGGSAIGVELPHENAHGAPQAACQRNPQGSCFFIIGLPSCFSQKVKKIIV